MLSKATGRSKCPLSATRLPIRAEKKCSATPRSVLPVPVRLARRAAAGAQRPQPTVAPDYPRAPAPRARYHVRARSRPTPRVRCSPLHPVRSAQLCRGASPRRAAVDCLLLRTRCRPRPSSRRPNAPTSTIPSHFLTTFSLPNRAPDPIVAPAANPPRLSCHHHASAFRRWPTRNPSPPPASPHRPAPARPPDHRSARSLQPPTRHRQSPLSRPLPPAPHDAVTAALQARRPSNLSPPSHSRPGRAPHRGRPPLP